MHYHLIMMVWGEAYTRIFLDAALPALLTPGNLDAFRPSDHPRFKIFTTAADALTIRASAAFQRLERRLPVDFIDITDALATKPDHWNVMSHCGQLAVRAADAEQAAMLLLSPDAIFAENAFKTVIRLVNKGKRVVVTPGFRIIRETTLPLFNERFAQATDEQPQAITARELVRLALDHIHPISSAYFAEADRMHERPSHLYWPVGNEGLVVHGLHQHPLLLYPRKLFLDFMTVDWNYIRGIGVRQSEMCVVTDSDDLFIAEMSNASYLAHEIEPRRLDIPAMGQYLTWATYPYHRAFFRQQIRFHAGEITPAWIPVQQQAARTVKQIMNQFYAAQPGYARREALRAAAVAFRRLLSNTKHLLRRLLGENFRQTILKQPLFRQVRNWIDDIRD